MAASRRRSRAAGDARAFVPFGEWLPDQPDYANPGAATITNVVPLTAQSYGPMPTMMAYSGALTARCQGSYSFLDKSGAESVFAGDATKLYRLTTGSAPNFADVSRLAGGAYTTSSAIDPAAPTVPFWAMTSFGERIIATNYSDAVQTFLVGTDANFSALSAGAPKARYAVVVRDFLLLGYTNDGTAHPHRVHWSAIGDPTNWPTAGSPTAISVQSDFQDLQQTDLGQITGLVGGHLSAADGAVFCERGVYRMTYVGSSGGIFAFQVAEGATGTQSPLSMVLHHIGTGVGQRNVVAYLGDDGFYMFDGMLSSSISGQKIDRTFFADLDLASRSAVQGAADPRLKLLYWAYNSSTGAGGGFYDRLLVYNWELGRWAICDLTATPAEWMTVAGTLGYTLDALDVFGVLDGLPAPLDSSIWLGARETLAMFNNSHKLALLTGPAMAPTVETSEAQLFPGRRALIISARPMVDAGGTDALGSLGAAASDGSSPAGAAVSGTASISIAARNRLVDARTYQAAIPVNVLGECPQRVTGRYVRARLTLPAGSAFEQLQGVDFEAVPQGRV